MAQALALARRLEAPALEAARALIVCGCALALILAGAPWPAL
jgi:hypothetical protein